MLRLKIDSQRERGQILVMVAISLFVLLVVIGLAIDSTLLYLNYSRLKRAVDAAAIAAANDFKRNVPLAKMKESALEILNMHQVNTAAVDIKIYMCDDENLPGVPDDYLNTEVPDFYAKCPKATQAPRKMIYLRAFERSQTYFVSLIGIVNVPISTTAIAEAAPVDLVIVLDTSGSMSEADPTCDPAKTECNPLKAASNAAKFLTTQLYPKYDRVAVVGFNTRAYTYFNFTQSASDANMGAAQAAIDTYIKPRVEPPVGTLFWGGPSSTYMGQVNPINPEDRDDNGSDDDSGTVSTQCTPNSARWDTTKNIPCDDATVFDAFDANGDTTFTGAASDACASATSDHCASKIWMAGNGSPMTLTSTCTGCGIREATNNLVKYGRPNAVWVIVFLSDGGANMTDTPVTFPWDSGKKIGIPSVYSNGFCGGQIDVERDDNEDNKTATPHKFGFNYWDTLCIDYYPSERWCMNDTKDTCPPDSLWTGDYPTANNRVSPPYSAEDYARDMIDRAALRFSTNKNEKIGNDIAIYTIGFGAAIKGITGSSIPPGAGLLRYMAAVGDDGNRVTDPCTSNGLNTGTPKAADVSCGQYYFAKNTDDFLVIFRDIASRIYTKIAE